ncbi:DUF7666 domain-containing protein [Enterocloster bolteae]|uniref:DUF7666 domain-containing protein n=1 Tax=Enterocloster bolteae TaxID=208479 RepID=UPI0028DBCFDA|nr:hypothetical protein [Enterocloster bolteae]
MMIAYKAFNKDLSCTSGGNRFQYRLGIWNEEQEANCARNGFHCAENPLDCLSYYSDWGSAVYYMVLADGDIDEDAHDSKISATRLKLVKQLNLAEFIAHSLRYMYEHPMRENNGRVCAEEGEAQRGFTVVRGKNPVAKGKMGDVLGFAKETADSRKVMEIGLFVVDGKEILPDTWYQADGSIVERIAA